MSDDLPDRLRFVPSRWWRVMSPHGLTFAESSDEADIRRRLETAPPGSKLQCYWECTIGEWRDER